ncbi:hypothetical protein ABF162_13725 [Vibrio coralliilyticus]|uniref:hypothetical protein n=1 Tax=Vibrio coralliilyticus TaxID=190893 RepID=UPI00068A154E|nr:hypothetical protein [Vibrio coralliilyticus]
MKLYLPCMICFSETERPDQVFYPAELEDKGYYKLRCQNGHIASTRLQNHKFEVLFELGMNAIVDGYYREAVTSFSAALERFYEFVINVLCREKGLSQRNLEPVWNKVSKLSERQLGAYLFLYAYVENSAPPTLSNNKTRFRNSVVHNGFIPTRKEALRYGQSVVDIIQPVAKLLIDKYEDTLQSITQEYLVSMTPIGDLEDSSRICTLNTLTTINLSKRNLQEPIDLERQIASVVRSRKGFESMCR